MKIFFATDIHGSETCWRKFLNSAAFYKVDLVVLGGDLTGKVMVPIVAHDGPGQQGAAAGDRRGAGGGQAPDPEPWLLPGGGEPG
jgi:Icc-related predicted phosphoesterase